MKFSTTLFVLLFSCVIINQVQAQTANPNIIFIIVDDLNDFTSGLGGHPQSETPNIATIAARGTEFTNAHCASPKCAPSRTAFLSGKDCKFSDVYNNPFCKTMSEYFEGQQVFPLPEYFKDSIGYFTIGINKIYHCFETHSEYDIDETDACARRMSWNKYIQFYNGESSVVSGYGTPNNNGAGGISWSNIPDSYEDDMYDYAAIDSAIQIIDDYENGILNTCGNPIFMAIGLRRPHVPLFIPEQYFSEHLLLDIYEEPFNYPYNNPVGEFPYNGIVMPAQPDPVWSDFDALSSIAQFTALDSKNHEKFLLSANGISPLPEISVTLTDPERREILEESNRANTVIAYLAAIKFVDAQIGRLYDYLTAHPDFLNNTIFVIVGDNGFSLGEKKHWQKGTMWERDMRVPFIIADMRNPAPRICNQAVSLLNLYPTLCDLVDAPEPEYSDGSKYLDGVSMKELMSNPKLPFEYPALGSYKLHSALAGEGCYPIYSVRNSDFHFIHYDANTSFSCNPLTRYTEEELYEIGNERNTDPHEWNNLVNDADYAIVKKYLSQWLPDSAKYLKNTYSIRTNGKQCTYQSSGNVSLTAKLYDENGNLISGIPVGKKVKWWTNLSADESASLAFNFSLAAIPEITSGAENEIIVYTALYNNDFTVMEALGLQHLEIDNTTTLYPKFSVKTKKKKATITAISYPSGTGIAVWDYGDGYVYTGLTPPPHTYPEYGTYTIKCTATITATGCKQVKEKTIVVDSRSHLYFKLYPNPSDKYLVAETAADFKNCKVEIFNSAGIKVLEQEFDNIKKYDLNISNLVPGNYVIRFSDEDIIEEHLFTKTGH